jgi:hypothetical protein
MHPFDRDVSMTMGHPSHLMLYTITKLTTLCINITMRDNNYKHLPRPGHDNTVLFVCSSYKGHTIFDVKRSHVIFVIVIVAVAVAVCHYYPRLFFEFFFNSLCMCAFYSYDVLIL